MYTISRCITIETPILIATVLARGQVQWSRDLLASDDLGAGGAPGEAMRGWEDDGFNA